MDDLPSSNPIAPNAKRRAEGSPDAGSPLPPFATGPWSTLAMNIPNPSSAPTATAFQTPERRGDPSSDAESPLPSRFGGFGAPPSPSPFSSTSQLIPSIPFGIPSANTRAKRVRVGTAKSDSLLVHHYPKEPDIARRLVRPDNEDADAPVEEEPDPSVDGVAVHPEPQRRRPKASPYKRANTASSVSSLVKLRVIDSDPNKANDPKKAICLLTNTSRPYSALQICHIIPRSVSDDHLNKMEWSWEMDSWSLYIDTRFNLTALMSDWHHAMDGKNPTTIEAKDWTLVPRHDHITQVHQWNEATNEADHIGQYGNIERNSYSQRYIDEKVSEFTYYFLPMSEEAKFIALHRYAADSDPSDITTHLHPFNDVGSLASHVQPHFVIFSTGEKLAKLTEGLDARQQRLALMDLATIASFGHTAPDDNQLIQKNLASLNLLLRLYEYWNSAAVPPPGHAWYDSPAKRAAEAEAAEKVRKAEAAKAKKAEQAEEKKKTKATKAASTA
ncbi:hypothetical protein R3P38DRAFT_2898863 [Favolaschia claudopus]|uniref:HNH nuclease domain-containing protein n=1 Tax=Favolaschia claudopus TaxID=2862362 RepID=A0AAW0CJY3_9AGAR